MLMCDLGEGLRRFGLVWFCGWSFFGGLPGFWRGEWVVCVIMWFCRF